MPLLALLEEIINYYLNNCNNALILLLLIRNYQTKTVLMKHKMMFFRI